MLRDELWFWTARMPTTEGGLYTLRGLHAPSGTPWPLPGLTREEAELLRISTDQPAIAGRRLYLGSEEEVAECLMVRDWTDILTVSVRTNHMGCLHLDVPSMSAVIAIEDYWLSGRCQKWLLAHQGYPLGFACEPLIQELVPEWFIHWLIAGGYRADLYDTGSGAETLRGLATAIRSDCGSAPARRPGDAGSGDAGAVDAPGAVPARADAACLLIVEPS